LPLANKVDEHREERKKKGQKSFVSKRRKV
jgi:hypothetical protein